jgi:hypothetical protein
MERMERCEPSEKKRNCRVRSNGDGIGGLCSASVVLSLVEVEFGGGAGWVWVDGGGGGGGGVGV